MDKPKVFGIGLSRTGTRSLSQALSRLGYRAIHWPQLLEEIAAHEAATDLTVACRYAELDRLFTGSKFILTVRELSSWVKSCVHHYRYCCGIKDLDEPKRTFTQEAEEIVYGPGGGAQLGSSEFEAAYRRHEGNVRGYFANRPGDLLALDIVGGEGWEKLAPFLGFPVPAAPFPHLNRRGPNVFSYV